ncbi:MAG: hypothetical protein LQ343_007497 [Gyalolechia ehrenbergii]|nr:MAG: hypothetical protein LQ343_007497 [Gyalolechia ehrenbergii]
MELSDPAIPQPSPSASDATTRRKSGRVKNKPVLLQADPNLSIIPNGNNKRKRITEVEEADIDNLDSEGSDSDESDGDPDEEELKEKRRKSRSKKAPIRPAAKKPKTSQPRTTNLPVRPAVNGAKKPSRPPRPRAKPNPAMADQGTGLFAELFAQGHTADAVAAEWITQYDRHNTNAMCELVNLVLKCTGCDLEVNVHDIEDPDNAASKLGDIQDEYQAKEITDYPLISKAKGYASFRSTVTGFFSALIQTAHAAGVLYSDIALIENIEVWVTTMSSSSIRPFRHTATVISLAMQSALCSVYSEIADGTANSTRQKEGELKRKAVNKDRVASIQKKVDEGERKLGMIDTMMENIFNAVYVHRYRDVDPKIRVECVTALGRWITAAPDKFFTANYLRYLGWVLSDTSAPTRTEVVKQLSKLYKRKEDIGRLHGFTERFRPRFVEMAMRDAEPNIRAAAIALLDLVRETGLLEPDDIDNVGRLVFDSEQKVRKAVAGFFAENIKDLFESVVEELGGEEGMAEAVGEDDPEDFDVPRKSWLKLKCLAEVLQLYSSEDDEENAGPDLQKANPAVAGAETESRFALAAQAVCQGVPDVKEWEVLAGYLLYDNSSALTNGNGPKSPDYLFRERCQLNEFEEMLLLEILNQSVKQRLLEAVESERDKKGRRTTARVEEAREAQENVAVHLAEIIPRLMRKFGANPTTAAVVLRLGHVLNLEIFEELRQGSTTYVSLLDDINKQFLTHVDQGVLAEASSAILHARTFEDLQEVTESKLQELWNDTISSLRALASARNNGKGFDLASLCNTVARIANLASVSDCISVLGSESRPTSKKLTQEETTSPPADILMGFITSDFTEADVEEAQERGQLTIDAIKSLLFYHMWLIRSIQTSLEAKIPVTNLPETDNFASALFRVMSTRSGTDPVRLAAAGACLDLYTLYASSRKLNSPPAPKDQPPSSNKATTTPANKSTQQRLRPTNLDSLIRPIPPECQTTLLAIFNLAEKHYARLSHRTLEPPPADDEEAVADAPEDSDSDADDEDIEDSEHRKTRILLAEKQLCELAGKMVLAIMGRMLDVDGKGKVRKRLKRNERRLGGDFREVLAFLDEGKGKAKPKAKPKPAETKRGGMKKGAGKGNKSREIVEVSSEEESGGEEEENGELADDRIEDEGDEGGGDGGEKGNEGVEDDIMGD